MFTRTKKLSILLGALTLSCIAVADDEIHVYGTRSAATQDDRAVQSCVDAFIAKALPGRHMKVSVMTTGARQVFGGLSDATQMDVSLSARARSSNALLASAVCTVSKTAKVSRLTTKVTDASTLAQLRSSDIRFASASH